MKGDRNMQIIVKTAYNGKEERETIENVTTVCQLDDTVAISFKADDGRNKTQYIKLDGYTELIVR